MRVRWSVLKVKSVEQLKVALQRVVKPLNEIPPGEIEEDEIVIRKTTTTIAKARLKDSFGKTKRVVISTEKIVAFIAMALFRFLEQGFQKVISVLFHVVRSFLSG